ncbi:hypothetical protein DRQ09_05895 [candidate division KSB1 bacterium]|nr:MAG: hypothetical protein DRQ09_05895 [candidate division KSB1 bacterium]
MKKVLISLLVYLLSINFSYSQESIKYEVISPEKFLGFKVGEDKKLADWFQIYNYFLNLDKSSDRVKVVNLGETTEGKPFILAYISSKNNILNLEKYKNIQHSIVNCGGLCPEEANRLFKEGKTVVLINASLHATEIGATQMTMELAYELATKDDSGIQEIRDNVILLLVPSANPDGLQMVVDWYKKTLGTKYEGTSPPYLYHKYVGHDNNRDWYMLTQKETKLLARILYREWFPEIVYDIHQMGSRGARFFVPPFYKIANSDIDPLIFREIMFLGGQITADLSAKGFTGIATNCQFTMFWHGGMRTAPYFHNMVGLLSEAASVKLATPVKIEFDQLKGRARGLQNFTEFQVNFPEPWKGGWWHLRDIVEMEKSMSYSILTSAAKNKEMWLRNFYIKNKRSIEKGIKEPPYAYVIPSHQRDPVTSAKMIKILIDQGIKVCRAVEKFEADGTVFPEDSYVVLLSQPFRPDVKALFERQKYPEIRQYPGGPVERPYDITGWTLPLQMGVETFRIDSPFVAKLTEVENVYVKDGIILPDENNKFYLFGHKMNNHFKVLNRLISKYNIAWLTEPVTINSLEFDAGTGVLPGNIDKESLKKIAKTLKIDFYGVDNIKNQKVYKLKKPELAVYKGWLGSIDEGWTRFVLEKFEFDYVSLSNKRIRQGELNRDFDVIIIPDIRMNSIINGRSIERVPEEYAGGIKEIGVNNLKLFVEKGGTLITLDSSCELPIKKFWIPVRNVLENVKFSEFFIPGSILRILVDNSHPVGYGMPREASAFFSLSPAFSVSGGRVIAKYPGVNPLLSCFLMGEKYLLNKAALVEIPLGKGKIILIGFRVQHRAQTWNTFKLLFNSIYYGSAELTDLDRVFNR